MGINELFHKARVKRDDTSYADHLLGVQPNVSEDVMDQPDNISLDEQARNEKRAMFWHEMPDLS